MIRRVTHRTPRCGCRRRSPTRCCRAEQIEILRAWIAQGAQYKPHWAFITPVKPAACRRCEPASRGAQRHRSVRRGRLEREGLALSPPGRQGNADQPRHADADRPAADAGRGGRVPEGHEPHGVREGGRSAAGVAGLRRAHGELLAGRRALFRERRVPGRSPRPAVLAVSRLGDRGVQQEHAVRPVRDVAAGGRPDAEPHEGADAGDGVPARRQAHDGERRDRRGVSRRVRGRSREHRRHGVPGPDGRLRALPRPQVRPDQPRRTSTRCPGSSTAPTSRASTRRAAPA